MKPLTLALPIAACLCAFPAMASELAPAKAPAFEKPAIDKEAAKAAVEKARAEIKAQNAGPAAPAEPQKLGQAQTQPPGAAPKKDEPAALPPRASEPAAPAAARRPGPAAESAPAALPPASAGKEGPKIYAAHAPQAGPAHQIRLHENKPRAKAKAARAPREAGPASGASAVFGPGGDAWPSASTPLAEAGLARNYMLLPFLQDRQTVMDRRGCLWTLRNANGYSEMAPAADGLCLQASRPLDSLAQRMEFAEYSRIAQYARRMADGTLFRDAYGCVYVFGPAYGKPAAPALARPDGSAACYDKGARP